MLFKCKIANTSKSKVGRLTILVLSIQLISELHFKNLAI